MILKKIRRTLLSNYHKTLLMNLKKIFQAAKLQNFLHKRKQIQLVCNWKSKDRRLGVRALMF